MTKQPKLSSAQKAMLNDLRVNGPDSWSNIATTQTMFRSKATSATRDKLLKCGFISQKNNGYVYEISITQDGLAAVFTLPLPPAPEDAQ